MRRLISELIALFLYQLCSLQINMLIHCTRRLNCSYLLSMLQKVSTAVMALLIGVGGSHVHTITPKGKLHTTRLYRFPALVA